MAREAIDGGIHHLFHRMNSSFRLIGAQGTRPWKGFMLRRVHFFTVCHAHPTKLRSLLTYGSNATTTMTYTITASPRMQRDDDNLYRLFCFCLELKEGTKLANPARRATFKMVHNSLSLHEILVRIAAPAARLERLLAKAAH